MGPARGSVERELQLADEALADATLLLEEKRLRAASNRAYYAMFHAAHAALAAEDVPPPRTHGGLVDIFGRHLVVTGRLDKSLATDLRDAYNLRQESDYRAVREVEEEDVTRIVQKAGSFFDEIRKLRGGA